jgi:hypothetical protein
VQSLLHHHFAKGWTQAHSLDQRYSPISTPNSTARCEVVCDKLLRAPENRARRQARLRRGVLSTRDRPRRRQRSSPARLKRKLVRRYCRPRSAAQSQPIPHRRQRA